MFNVFIWRPIRLGFLCALRQSCFAWRFLVPVQHRGNVKYFFFFCAFEIQFVVILFYEVMASTLTASLIHWKKKLERTTDDETILTTIHKLSKVPITLDLLQDTGIGKVIRSLAKKPGKVGSKASSVLLSWRDVVAAAQKTPESSKHEHKKHSHKKDVSNGERNFTEKRSKQSSHENHKKSKHSSSHKDKYAKDTSDHSSVNGSDFEREEKHKSNREVNGDIKKQKNSEPHSSKSSNDVKYKNRSDTIFEKESRKRSSSNDSSISIGKRQKYEFAEDLNNTPHTKRDKSNGSHSSNSNSSLDIISSHSKKKDKDKTSSKESLSNGHKSEKSKVKRDKDSKKKSSSRASTSLSLEPTEGFTASEGTFEDLLNFNDVFPVKKKKSSKLLSERKEKSNPVKKEVPESPKVVPINHKRIKSEIPDVPKLLQQESACPKPPVINEVDILSTLPQTQTHYRPLPHRSYDESSGKKKVLSNEEAIKFTSSRREKTSVYSGKKTVYTEVPTLMDCCIRILIDNIDAIEYMGGGLPYFIVKQVLEKCTAQQLHNIEHFNPDLLDETQELWEAHCKKDFRHLRPQDGETWRDLYWRAMEERERKFKNITANISASMSTKYKPGRSVKLAYVDSVVKPPRDVARRQAKNGTALPVNLPVKAGPPSKATPRPVAPAKNVAATQPREVVIKKPKVAPLMAKTLKSMKQCFRR